MLCGTPRFTFYIGLGQRRVVKIRMMETDLVVVESGPGCINLNTDQ